MNITPEMIKAGEFVLTSSYGKEKTDIIVTAIYEAMEAERFKPSAFDIKVIKCRCGHKSCSTYQLGGFGIFYQGSGFEKEQAELIARLLNKHYQNQRSKGAQ